MKRRPRVWRWIAQTGLPDGGIVTGQVLKFPTPGTDKQQKNWAKLPTVQLWVRKGDHSSGSVQFFFFFRGRSYCAKPLCSESAVLNFRTILYHQQGRITWQPHIAFLFPQLWCLIQFNWVLTRYHGAQGGIQSSSLLLWLQPPCDCNGEAQRLCDWLKLPQQTADLSRHLKLGIQWSYFGILTTVMLTQQSESLWYDFHAFLCPTLWQGWEN